MNVVERVDEPTALRKLRERYAVGDLTFAELDELTGRVLGGDHAAAWPSPPPLPIKPATPTYRYR